VSATIPGPEVFLAGRPLLVVSLVFVQLIVTLVLVGVLSRRRERAPAVYAVVPASISSRSQ